ncbi:DNA glycosylase AlkZ-like family protein [Tsukamurella sp. PLM1]|uniref:DNA glycosylase AlkZ-like family protein n=1 Tax=Tsukamurella sp. PLM1 TaxID=2929795 RepID=UPI0020507416|nr:crosslink repair DNA glycosylase YcaQ family protein [Tsukamurella sp. PLM1]BDH59559.1 hypothetical protein MTP03_44980 [Tsukamurella sp. PLM1]
MPTFTTDRILAFRLRAHALADRLDEDGRAAAASRCGIQDSPPGSALLALNARVRGVTAGTVDDALAQRELVRTWSMRGAPFVVPAGDLPVFTTGVLPPSEAGAQRLILGVGPALDALGIGLDGAVSLIAARTHEVLSGRRLAIDALGAEVARAVEPDLSAAQRTVWRSEGPHAPGQPIGEAVVHFCVRILCLQRVVCFAPREGNSAPFVLADEWLGPPTAAASADDARAELARRYLRCYGPSTRAGLATWLGIRSGDAEPWWTAVEPELERVDTDGGPAWILATDRPALADAAAPSGVRLLPPRDPYTQAPDRSSSCRRNGSARSGAPSASPGPSCSTAGSPARGGPASAGNA